MKKSITIIVSLFSILFFVSSVTAGEIPSAKGSAAISKNILLEARDRTHSWDPVLSTMIQVASQKELACPSLFEPKSKKIGGNFEGNCLKR